jgi:hypothetical protein
MMCIFVDAALLFVAAMAIENTAAPKKNSSFIDSSFVRFRFMREPGFVPTHGEPIRNSEISSSLVLNGYCVGPSGLW